ncbi:hypothetical protein DI487_04035 [Flavobacterium sediminis]|uniref:SusE outer membrane protein domain-containing protein n=1 Tax=Flavobacterium sediminis TaxID=2201181 RepID=A0A2U8QSH8_9FLAO|nr:SusE domain-containing protein [Flavobacterium sediminis]AWM13122.1 hypothetical protein DI487_04035 [Flavobacterium sediminis]
MKNIVKSLFVLLSVFAISCSTDDVQDRPVIQGVDAPVLTAPEDGNTYTLLPENMDALAERFVWTAANYNGNVAINYSVEMDLTGGDFSNAQVLGGTSSDLQAPVTVETLNNACTALGANPYEASSFDVRVVSSVGSNSTAYSPMVSNIVTIVITPYTTESPKLYVIGNFLSGSGYGADWTPDASLPALASSGYGLTDFEGYVYMNVTSPEFKLLPTNSSFDGDYGDDGTFTGALLQDGEVNVQLSAGSYYKINANTTTMTYTTTATQWAVTGSATTLGWPAGPDGTDGQDVDLTYNTATKKWEVITTLTGGQELKFRANNAWTLNYGDDGADGSLNEGGANITIATTGSYLIELDLSNPREYTYTLTAQ